MACYIVTNFFTVSLLVLQLYYESTENLLLGHQSFEIDGTLRKLFSKIDVLSSVLGRVGSYSSSAKTTPNET